MASVLSHKVGDAKIVVFAVHRISVKEKKNIGQFRGERYSEAEAQVIHPNRWKHTPDGDKTTNEGD